MLANISAPPRKGGGFVSRRRLARHTDDVLARRLSVVQAPAGFGKSTMLRQWRDLFAAGGHVAAWLQLDRHASDIVGLSIAALVEASAAFRQSVAPLLASRGEFVTTDAELAALVAAMQASDRHVLLLIDDVHLLGAGELRVLERMVDRLPPNAHIVLASRETLDLPLARLRAHGDLFEMSMNELRFTIDEARQLLAVRQQAHLNDNEVASLVERTEGWAAGLQLAGLALSTGTSGAKLVASFSGRKSVVADFFSEDVFGSQPRDIQEFLLTSCLLERFSAELCNAVTGRSDSREMLCRIEVSGLFLIRLDDENQWFRYHGLFADFLARRIADIDPAIVVRTHLTASRWFHENGYLIEALDHAVSAGDQEWLAKILESSCEELIYRGKLTFVVKLAEAIERRVRVTHPRIMMAVAWLRMRNLRLEEARSALEIARARIAALQEGGLDSEAAAALRLTFQHREMMLAAASDDFAGTEELANQLMREGDQLSPYIVCNAYGQTIRAQREQFKFQQFERYEARARSVLERSKHKFAYVAQQAIVGITQFQLCRTDEAEQALRHGVGQAIDFAGEGSPLAALPALPLAVVHYERNELDQAQTLVDRYLPVARVFGFSDEVMCGYLVRAGLLSSRGDLPASLAALDEARSVGFDIGLDRIVQHADAEKIRLLLQHGNFERAFEVARTGRFLGDNRSYSPKLNATTTDELAAKVIVRLALGQGEVGDALSLIQRWRQFCIHRNATRHLLSWNLLLAQAQLIAGDGRVALRSLREALVAAAEGRNLRIFLSEGPRIYELLAKGYGSGLKTKHPVDMLAYELLGLFESRPRAPTVDDPKAIGDDSLGVDGKMTGREIEILACVASGLRNKEIGDRLGLTEGSVKWYMQRIYDKVGTRRRSLAVERARQFGFLS